MTEYDMQSPLTILPMDEAALEPLVAIELACFSNPWSKIMLAAELTNPAAVFRVARLNDRIVGYAGMHHIYDEGQITNVAVDPAFRRHGIAAALMLSLLDYAQKNAIRVMILEVRPSNTAAIRLYERLGFAEMGRRRNYYTKPTEDALLMTKELQL